LGLSENLTRKFVSSQVNECLFDVSDMPGEVEVWVVTEDHSRAAPSQASCFAIQVASGVLT
jgi:hypothetical protein